jgi:flavin reductase (DIM6/NTAB) family NADH-FMN oxidoreductase RutF
MKAYPKKNFPVDDVRHYLEPGPTLLVSSAWRGKRDVMTMGWQTTMEFNPSLVGCVIAESNYSFDLIRASKQCVINVPTVDLIRVAAKIGNCCGDTVDKFKKFRLTTSPASIVSAPLIDQCVASFECKLIDGRLIKKYNFFIFKVVKAHAAPWPRYPKTFHYHGKGVFSIAGGRVNLRRLFTKWPD